MPVVEPDEHAVEEWRPGVQTRLLASAATGATSLCVFEQWSQPGAGAPTHAHPDAEEVLVVLEGEARIWLGDEKVLLRGCGSAVVPSGVWHGFENVGRAPLHTLAVFASAAPSVRYREQPDETLRIGERRQGPHRRAIDGESGDER